MIVSFARASGIDICILPKIWNTLVVLYNTLRNRAKITTQHVKRRNSCTHLSLVSFHTHFIPSQKSPITARDKIALRRPQEHAVESHMTDNHTNGRERGGGGVSECRARKCAWHLMRGTTAGDATPENSGGGAAVMAMTTFRAQFVYGCVWVCVRAYELRKKEWKGGEREVEERLQQSAGRTREGMAGKDERMGKRWRERRLKNKKGRLPSFAWPCAKNVHQKVEHVN